MKNKLAYALVASIVASVGLSLTSVLPIASSLGATSTTDQTLNFYSNDVYNDGTGPFAFTDVVIGSSSTSNEFSTIFCPAKSTDAWVFATDPGTEFDKPNWTAFTVSGFKPGSTEVLTPNLQLSGLSEGSASLIKAAGGTYSLGVACTDSGGAHVNYTVFRTITVTKRTGAWFADPLKSTSSPTPSVTPSGTTTPTPTNTPSPTSPATESAERIYFFNNDAYVPSNTNGVPFNFTDNVIGSTSASSITSRFNCPAKATGAWVFVSDVGSENIKTSWLAFTVSGLVPGTTQILTPNLQLSGLSEGSAQLLKSQGGDYSLGLACTENDGALVDYVSFRSINITKRTGTWTAAPETGGVITPSPTPTPTSTPTPTQTSTPAPTQTATPTPTATTPPAAILPVKRPSWFDGSSIYQVDVRQATQAGTFASFKTQIPRLKVLGVKVLDFLPLTPISQTGHQGTLGSEYAVDDYHAVNTEFITTPRGTEQEFSDLVYYAHLNGMKVIVGWNAQATGLDNPWYLNHKDWYQLDSNNKPLNPNNGYGQERDKALLNYSNSDMRTAMISELKYWVSHFKVDGFSCAHAAAIPVDFLDRVTAEVNVGQNGNLLWIADAIKADLSTNSIVAGYNDALYGLIHGLPENSTTAAQLMAALATGPSISPLPNFKINYTSNDYLSGFVGSDVTILGAANSLASVLNFTAPGVPLIFNGQEVGLRAMLKPYDKNVSPWPTSASANKTTAFYNGLIRLRKANGALTLDAGPVVALKNNGKNVLSFSRISGVNKVIVIANLSNKTATVTLDTKSLIGSYFDFSSGKKIKLAKTLKLNLAKYGYVVYSTTAAK